MSESTLKGRIKWLGLGGLRYGLLLLGGFGVLAIVDGEYTVGLLFLSVPVYYFGRYAWEGYQEDTPE